MAKVNRNIITVTAQSWRRHRGEISFGLRLKLIYFAGILLLAVTGAVMIPELQKIVRSYLDEGRGRTQQSIALKAGVSASTVRRIAQGELRKTSLANVLALLDVVATPGERFAFLNAHFPETGKYLEKVATAAGIAENIDDDLKEALYDGERFTIISLASTPVGCTEAQVTSVLGHAAKAKLDDLLDAGVLVSENGRYHTRQRDFAPTSNTSVLAQIAHCARFIRDEHIGQQKQHCAIRTNGVSREGQIKLHAIIQKALEEAGEVILGNPGPLPIFVTATMGTFATESTNA